MQRVRFITMTAAAMASPIVLPEISFAGEATAGRLAAVERRMGGRLGVYAMDTGDKRSIAYRANERFAMCSTFKFLLTGAVLARVDAGRERLDRRIAFGERDLLEYAPVTRAHVREGSMTVSALCAAAIEQSDNTAGNLLLRSIGGPAAFTQYARSLGDPATRLDRDEPSLNTAIPGDARDTTTPHAMVRDMELLLLRGKLSAASRGKLSMWLDACRTGTDCIRAGIPATWAAGDKTGSGQRGTRNDIAILRPPDRAPVLVAAYLTGSTAPSAARNAALAEVGRIVTESFATVRRR